MGESSPRNLANGENDTRLIRTRCRPPLCCSFRLDVLSESLMGLAYDDNVLRIGRGMVSSQLVGKSETSCVEGGVKHKDLYDKRVLTSVRILLMWYTSS